MKQVLIALLAFLFLLALAGAFAGVGPWRAVPAGEEGFAPLSDALFERFVLPFEVLGVLLLAALIGAICLAKRERGKGKGGSP